MCYVSPWCSVSPLVFFPLCTIFTKSTGHVCIHSLLKPPSLPLLPTSSPPLPRLKQMTPLEEGGEKEICQKGLPQGSIVVAFTGLMRRSACVCMFKQTLAHTHRHTWGWRCEGLDSVRSIVYNRFTYPKAECDPHSRHHTLLLLPRKYSNTLLWIHTHSLTQGQSHTCVWQTLHWTASKMGMHWR